jgi:hypothetical protein
MKQIHKLMATPGSMARLKQELTRQKQLLEQVRACLPATLKPQLLAAVLTDKALTLWVNSPAWASRLRYLAPQLMRQLRQQGLAIEHLHPRIIPPRAAMQPSRRRRVAGLSEKSAEILRQTAESLEAGPLREALRRLSRHR